MGSLRAALFLCRAWLVAADDPAAPASACQEIVRGLRSPRAFLVRLGMAFELPRLDQGIDDLPRELDLLSARERRVPAGDDLAEHVLVRDRKSTRLNSSHGYISYAVFCLKK